MRSTAVIGAMTLFSRLLGFARDILIARCFGADAATDAFFVAFRIPNFLRRLFAEGAFAQAFVPALTEPGRAAALLNPLAGSLAVILFVASAVGAAAAPILIFVFAPGFSATPETWQLSVDMLRITFPYLFFVVLTALAGAALNSRGRFAVPAFTPALLNIAMIAATLWLAPRLPEPITALAWGVLAAGLLQLLLQLPALARAGLLPKPRCEFGNPEVRRVLTGMAPAIFGVSVTQINLLINTLIASFLVSGSVSWLYYSDRLVEFPLGLLGAAAGTAILPHLTATHVHKDAMAFSDALDWGLRWVLLIALPATAGLVLLAPALLASLFQGDEFTAGDVAMASRSLSCYALGLPAYVAIKVLAPGFSARHDLTTPVRLGFQAMVANAVLGAALGFALAPQGWGHAGLALATSLSAIVNAACLLSALRRIGVYRPRAGWGLLLVRAGGATLLMSGFLLLKVADLPWQSWPQGERAFYLIWWIVCGAVIYLGALWLAGIRRVHLVLQPTG